MASYYSASVTRAAYSKIISQIRIGKRLPAALYILDEANTELPLEVRQLCAELRTLHTIGAEFNLLKFHTIQPKISFLSYPGFFEDAHPVLRESVVVDLTSGKVRRDDYSDRLNPPVLHRKETFLHPDNPSVKHFAELTAAEEAAGLLEDTERIGFKLNWERVLEAKGVRIEGHKLHLAPGNQTREVAEPAVVIQRHRTAIARTAMSKPTRSIIEHNLLKPGESFFDYGCGHGADVSRIRALGYEANGWDPVHAPHGAKRSADVVNLGYVLNVIEDPAERVDVLLRARALAKRLLVVSTMIRGQEAYEESRNCGDGLLTKINTFQKYFAPAEIQSFIEDALGLDAVPVALGIYFVFVDTADLQDFLLARSRRHIDWTSLSEKLGFARRAPVVARDPYLENKELLDSFWQTLVTLGRVPAEDEFARLPEIKSICGSAAKAGALFVERFGTKTLEVARTKRKEDVLVYVSAALLRRKKRQVQLSDNLRRDVRAFFGGLPEAERAATELLYAAGDVDELALAIQNLGFGWWDEAEHQYTIHRSLLDELPVLLRVFVECAARLYGNPREADLIKFHLRSRKLTFSHYGDFDHDPFPELQLRIKIDLPKLFVNVIEPKPGEIQLLYFKERFVKPGYVGFDAMAKRSARLRKLGFDEKTFGYGPTKTEFALLLEQNNLTRQLLPKRR